MTKAEIQAVAYEILDEYQAQGIVMTLRQLYYQFVARGLLGSGQAVYNRVGAATRDARLDGTIPIDWIEDRGRHVGRTTTHCFDDVDVALAEAASEIQVLPMRLLQRGRWFGQPVKVFVWIEKEALAGVLEGTCDRLGVGLFPCKGYPSVSAISSWVSETYLTIGFDETATIIYLGDHDPDGLQIPRSALDLIRKIQHVKGEHFDVDLEYVALTMDQIDEHNPPPFPAKVTSPRYRRYVDDTGTEDAWELDALDPLTLRTLVETEVERRFDAVIRSKHAIDIRRLRKDLVDRMQSGDWIYDVFKGLG